jgi:hypothetical protein
MNDEVRRERLKGYRGKGVGKGADLLYATPDILFLGAHPIANCDSVPNL